MPWLETNSPNSIWRHWSTDERIQQLEFEGAVRAMQIRIGHTNQEMRKVAHQIREKIEFEGSISSLLKMGQISLFETVEVAEPLPADNIQ